MKETKFSEKNKRIIKVRSLLKLMIYFSAGDRDGEKWRWQVGNGGTLKVFMTFRGKYFIHDDNCDAPVYFIIFRNIFKGNFNVSKEKF